MEQPDANANPVEPNSDGQNQGQQRPRTRMCWICHDTVEATYEEQGVLDGLRNRRPRRRYIGEDGDPLINPCHCRGSVKWVHEGCLRTWMNTNPEAWRCGRCRYEYRLERLTWAQRLRSPLLAIGLTLLILILVVFLLGFVGDHILSFWLDPVGTISDQIQGSYVAKRDADLAPEEEGWLEHFLKGLFSLGLLGFVQAFLVLTPWQWWNLRTSGLVGGGGARRAGGRQRLESVNMALVLIGVFTFLSTTWKATRKFVEGRLEQATRRILNIQDEEEESDQDEQ